VKTIIRRVVRDVRKTTAATAAAAAAVAAESLHPRRHVTGADASRFPSDLFLACFPLAFLLLCQTFAVRFNFVQRMEIKFIRGT